MILEDLTSRLASLGLVSDRGVGVFHNYLPDAPDDVVCLYEYMGRSGILTMNIVGTAYERCRIQVVVRSMTYRIAAASAAAISKALEAIRSESIGGVYYVSVFAMQPPFFLRRDEQRRYEMAFNVEVTRAVDREACNPQ